MVKKKEPQYTSFRPKEGQITRLREIGVELDRDVSWLIRTAIDEFIKRFDQLKEPNKK